MYMYMLSRFNQQVSSSYSKTNLLIHNYVYIFNCQFFSNENNQLINIKNKHAHSYINEVNICSSMYTNCVY